eukprot:3084302-Alexandrium_andersonii.AAC.1
MSASLVGSEMCIRDRPCFFGRSSPTPNALTPPSIGGMSVIMRTARPLSCLLYTSDAADDM